MTALVRTSFRTLLEHHRPLVCPSAHDALSARLIELAGFSAIAVGGMSMLASQQALPDIGLAALADMVDGARCIMRGTSLPFGMDADDGFGDAKSVVRTAQAFAALGAGQLVLEDQLRVNKKPSDMQALEVIPIAAMQQKLGAAIHGRGGADLMIIARTDSFASEGIGNALRRAEAYLAAGADGIFIAGLPDLETLRRAGAALRGAVHVTVVTERHMANWAEPAELYDMGFVQVAFPNLLISRVAEALRTGLADLTEIAAGRRRQNEVPNFARAASGLQGLLGLDDWIALDRRYA